MEKLFGTLGKPNSVTVIVWKGLRRQKILHLKTSKFRITVETMAHLKFVVKMIQPSFTECFFETTLVNLIGNDTGCHATLPEISDTVVFTF